MSQVPATMFPALRGAQKRTKKALVRFTPSELAEVAAYAAEHAPDGEFAAVVRCLVLDAVRGHRRNSVDKDYVVRATLLIVRASNPSVTDEQLEAYAAFLEEPS